MITYVSNIDTYFVRNVGIVKEKLTAMYQHGDYIYNKVIGVVQRIVLLVINNEIGALLAST